MFSPLLAFECRYYSRKPLLYISLAVLFVLGFLSGSSTGFTFPNVYKNSAYEITYFSGLLSLASVFIITLIVAQHALREQESRFGVLIAATPVPVNTYLGARFTALTLVCVLCFSMAVAGIFTGNLFADVPADKTGAYHLSYYLWPLLVIGLPNVFITAGLLCSIAWLSHNKMLTYLSGLLLYIVYIAGSIFSNSPLIAGSTLPTTEQMSLAAKLDPFGLAAFFEQTRYWTAVQRNTRLVAFSGNLLLNRLLWMGVVSLLARLAFARYRHEPAKKHKTTVRTDDGSDLRNAVYRRTQIFIGGIRHDWRVIRSYLKIDLLSLVKRVPFAVVFVLWTGLLGIELFSALQGDPRLGANFARTGLLVTTVLETFPLLMLPVLLFYSSELLWKSKASGFAALESVTPANPVAILMGKTIALCVIPLLLILYSIAICIGVQWLKGFDRVDPALYLSLFYYAGTPMALTAILVTVLQYNIPNRYAGLGIAALVVLLTGSRVGLMAGLIHPLFRFGNLINISYGDMNGFDGYSSAFAIRTIYNAGAIALLTGAGVLLRHRKELRSSRRWWIFASLGALTVISAVILILKGYHAGGVSGLGGNDLSDWKEQYERRYRPFAAMLQPVITDVHADVDLYPAQHRYDVSGFYTVQNKEETAIDSLLIYMPVESVADSLVAEGAHLSGDNSYYRHYWFVFDKPLMPGSVFRLRFRFHSGWSPMRGHTAFNSIIGNGSFMRISNYFPSIGYESGNEITNEIERSKRQMGEETQPMALDAPADSSKAYQFINLDLGISTASDQTAITSGTLTQRSSSNGRNYFRYRSDTPMPFRFAVSSARYLVAKSEYRNIPIEVYYDRRHSVNVSALIAEARRTLAYGGKNFGSYPHTVVRFAEISSFAEGFAATAYPGVVYMRENAGFYNDISNAGDQDVINQLAGHELTHEWWGSAMFAPEYREGGWILTESLANYTALMLYGQAHGADAALSIVKQHLDQYNSNRSYATEPPLFRTKYTTPHLSYNKGLLALYQLQLLGGAESVSRALHELFAEHSFPKTPATAKDLVNALYKNLPFNLRHDIDDRFTRLVVWDASLASADAVKTTNGYSVSFSGTVAKYIEDGSGHRTSLVMKDTVQLAVYGADNKQTVLSLPVTDGKVNGKCAVGFIPVRAVIDPEIQLIDVAPDNNMKPVTVR